MIECSRIHQPPLRCRLPPPRSYAFVEYENAEQARAAQVRRDTQHGSRLGRGKSLAAAGAARRTHAAALTLPLLRCCPAAQKPTQAALNGYQLDKAHKFAATLFDEFERLDKVRRVAACGLFGFLFGSAAGCCSAACCLLAGGSAAQQCWAATAREKHGRGTERCRC